MTSPNDVYTTASPMPRGTSLLRESSTGTFQPWCDSCGWHGRRMKMTNANRIKVGDAARKHIANCKATPPDAAHAAYMLHRLIHRDLP